MRINRELTRHDVVSDAVYLDHAGTTLYSRSLMDRFAAEMTSTLFGNPHSASPSSQRSTFRIEDIRLQVLQLFKADPAAFDIVFVPNATAGIKLVLEAFRDLPGGFDYAYHQACHTSLVGVREVSSRSVCVDDVDVWRWAEDRDPFRHNEPSHGSATLFAYTAQSNMDGSRFPLSWSETLRKGKGASSRPFYTLLDAASLVATSPLDLSDSSTAPDFVVLSFYKMFGFPDLGALIVRKEAEPVFQSRRYFGGGTVDTVVCLKEQWHALKEGSLHDRLEDGTLPIHSIMALDAAIRTHTDLFGDMYKVSAHTSFLAKRMYDGLASLRHANGEPVCVIYSHGAADFSIKYGHGPIVAFNIRNYRGAWVGLAEFEKLATLKSFHIRTGGVCNPGGIAAALELQPWEMKHNFSAGFRCGNENDIMGGKPVGVIRVSLGAMSIISDVDKFLSFVDEFFRDQQVSQEMPPSLGCETTTDSPAGLHVHSVIVYPIKSCGGYVVPNTVRWDIRPEGLAWDREWCLVHRGSGRALNQKQYPRMALFRPSIDFEEGLLRVAYTGHIPQHLPKEVSVPLSANPSLFESSQEIRSRASRVCGEEIFAQAYISSRLNDYFTEILQVPCALARFPPGGHGKSMRYSKAHLQRYQTSDRAPSPSYLACFPLPPSPPDSDSEPAKRQRILLSNESPILAINLASLAALNERIQGVGEEPVSAAVFRANVVIGSSLPQPPDFAYSEDQWKGLRIGVQEFSMLGSCRRCHMVCIDQKTGKKRQEPFITLAKTRRFDGKVFFGTHMCHVINQDARTCEAQHPTIQVGETVAVRM